MPASPAAPSTTASTSSSAATQAGCVQEVCGDPLGVGAAVQACLKWGPQQAEALGQVVDMLECILTPSGLATLQGTGGASLGETLGKQEH